jgi:AraC-like DNA-binding protein
MDNTFQLNFIPPDSSVAGFVESMGMFHNQSANEKEVVVLPDGRIDLFFWKPAAEPFQVLLIGLETFPEQRIVPPHTRAFVVSFKPLAVEYILQTAIADILNSAKNLAPDFWGFGLADLDNFEAFKQKITRHIAMLLPAQADARKVKLFNSIYASNGEMSVAQLSAQAGWSSRQINRYFTRQLGLSLKAYCNILRFRASLTQLYRSNAFHQKH